MIGDDGRQGEVDHDHDGDSASRIDSLHDGEEAPALDLGPEQAIADSLNSALRHLRKQADGLAQMPVDEERVRRAEEIAAKAAELDEQIGSIARKDDT